MDMKTEEARTQYLSFRLNHSDIWLHVDRRGKALWTTETATTGATRPQACVCALAIVLFCTYER